LRGGDIRRAACVEKGKGTVMRDPARLIPAHEQMALQELARCAKIAREQFVAPAFVHTWDLRGLRGGTCQQLLSGLSGYHLRFNAEIARAEGEAYRQTVAHEYAHGVVLAMREKLGRNIVGFARKRWAAHGTQWEAVMRAFGREPRRCHNYESAERAVERRVYAYRCACNIEHKVSIIRHRKARAGKAVYRCSTCKEKLREA